MCTYIRILRKVFDVKTELLCGRSKWEKKSVRKGINKESGEVDGRKCVMKERGEASISQDNVVYVLLGEWRRKREKGEERRVRTRGEEKEKGGKMHYGRSYKKEEKNKEEGEDTSEHARKGYGMAK